MQINTCEESKAAANDDELPPELEQVDSDQLKAENAKQSQEEKTKKQMYEQMRNNKAREDDDDEGCTVEEIVDEPAEENKQ